MKKLFCFILITLFILSTSVISLSFMDSEPSPPCDEPTPAQSLAEKKKIENKKKQNQINTKDKKRQDLINKHPDWSYDTINAIMSGSVQIGMTKEQARIAWGKPDRINSTHTARGTTEQWCYGYRSFLYFDNGILRSVQN